MSSDLKERVAIGGKGTASRRMRAQLSENAMAVLQARYLRKDARRNVIETPEDMFWRVAWSTAQAELAYAAPAVAEDRVRQTAELFYEMMARLDFVPNSPTLMNAGRTLGQYFACFVLPIMDAIVTESDEGIFDTVRSAAYIHKSGGGTGFSFSRLRPEGSVVATSHGKSSGPISFLKVFNQATDAINQGGFRRGANMAMMRVDHPDILDFINVKADLSQLCNFNLSVSITDEFIQAVREDRRHSCIDPRTGERIPLRTKIRSACGDITGYEEHNWGARELFEMIVHQAWSTGEPGVVFIDRINKFNPTPQIGEIEATNPCVPADTWVLTEEGPRQVSDLIGKPSVMILDGERHPSETGFFQTGVRPTHEVITKEGFRFRATADHKVRRVGRMTRYLRDTEWAPVSELQPGDLLALGDQRELRGWPGPGTEGQGYLLGLLVGDGTLKDDEAVLSVWGTGEGPDAVRRAAEAAARQLPHRADFAGFQALIEERQETRLKLAALRDLAFEYDLHRGAKSVTPTMEKAGSSFQIGFLRGLFDADGCVQGDLEKGVSIRLGQSDMETLEAVQRMLLRLGVVSQIYRERRPAGTSVLPDGRGGAAEYSVRARHELVVAGDNLPHYRDRIGFEHIDKKLKLEGILASYRRDLNRERFVATVAAVKPVGEEPVYDIQVPGAHAFDGNGVHLHNCGEQPLLPWEACNLGSINLGHFVCGEAGTGSAEERVDWKRLARQVHLGVRFLDNVIDVNNYPKPQIEKIVKRNRKIGLGIMGWADMLYKVGIPYNSEEGVGLGRKVMRFIKDEGWRASMELARERGGFTNFEGSLFTTASLDHEYFPTTWKEECTRQGRRVPIRNATVTTIAPTGTISIVAGASGGIEPLFSLAFVRQVLNGRRLTEVNPYFRSVAEEQGFFSDEMIQRVMREGSLCNIDEASDAWKKVFVTARDISPEWHLRMQAAFQEHTDNAVSKTINFPAEATKDDVRMAYELAMELGLKGATIYRDGCRADQPMALNNAAKSQDSAAEALLARRRRPIPDELRGIRFKFTTNLGNAYITITEDDQGPRECFTSIGKAGSDINAASEAICRLISTSLGYGVPMESLAKQLLNITSQPVFNKGGVVKSLPDAIGQAMLRYLERRQCTDDVSSDVRDIGKPTGALCPDCGGPLVFEESCSGGKCNSCGFSSC